MKNRLIKIVDALEQIDTRQYTQALRNDGYQKI